MAQPVDPFIPLRRHVKRPGIQPTRRLIVNTIQPSKQTPALHPAALIVSAPAPRPQQAPNDTPPLLFQTELAPQRRKGSRVHTGTFQRLFHSGQYAIFIVLIVLAGVVAQFAIAGETAIFAYAFFVIIKRVDSRTTFIFALL